MSARLMKEYREAASNKDTDIRLTVQDNLYKWTAFIQGSVMPFNIWFPESIDWITAGHLELLLKAGTSKFSLTCKRIIHINRQKLDSSRKYFTPTYIFVLERWDVAASFGPLCKVLICFFSFCEIDRCVLTFWKLHGHLHGLCIQFAEPFSLCSLVLRPTALWIATQASYSWAT